MSKTYISFSLDLLIRHGLNMLPHTEEKLPDIKLLGL